MKTTKPPLIGSNIQRIRKSQNLTLAVLAERSGVSKAMLSQIESERVNPTVATVWKIARGLEVELDALLKGRSVRKFTVTGREDVTTLSTSENSPHLRVLSPLSMAEDLEIYLLTFTPQNILESQPHAPGTEEYLTVLDGEIEVTAGEKTTSVGKGDFIIYSCDVEHVIRNTGSKEAKIHMIVRFSRRHWD